MFCFIMVIMFLYFVLVIDYNSICRDTKQKGHKMASKDTIKLFVGLVAGIVAIPLFIVFLSVLVFIIN